MGNNLDDINRQLHERSAVWRMEQNDDSPPEEEHTVQKRDGLLHRLFRWIRRPREST